ncbi:hypothetical protein GJAV_G00248720 [Gymnothorax javanicus]|nr:hypothetical protein GJAV_G00248720 [Gymnothorax javanicus]
MSNEVLFRTQLASIMEVLANAAVEEICKLVDEGYAVLHLQMSEYQKENDALKMRLHFMELRAAHESAERASALEIPLDKHMDGAPTLREKSRGTIKESPTVALGSGEDIGVEGLVPVVNEGNPSATFSLKQVGASEVDSLQSEIILIKEETPEEFSEPQTDLKSPARGALDSGAADEAGVATPGLRVSSAERSKQLSVPHRSGVWEVSGLEAVPRLQAENVEDQSRGSAGLGRAVGLDGHAGGLRGLRSLSAAGSEIPGCMPTLTGIEAMDQSHPFCGENSEFHAAHLDLPSVSHKPPGSGVGPSPLAGSDLKAEVTVLDCVKEEATTQHTEWDKEPPAPARVNTQRGHRRETQDAQPEPLNPVSLHSDWLTGQNLAAPANCFNGLGTQDRNLGGSCNFTVRCTKPTLERRFLCNFCGKGFSRQNALDIHRRAHTGEKPFRCAKCGKHFSDSSNLRRHQSIHTRERPFARARVIAQRGHHRGAQEAQPEPLTSSSLPHDWLTGQDLTAVPPAPNPGCMNVIVVQDRNLGGSCDFTAGRHKPTKERRFLCHFCGKGFSSQNALEIHRRVHTGEKPFRCAQCGKRFSDCSNLRRHQSVHSRERPFSCTQCERNFSHHYQLKVHQRVHTGEKPFHCALCGKTFGEQSSLKLHQQRDHAPL